MNLTRLLPPAAALVIVGGWLGIQRLSIHALEGENALLRNHIAAARLVNPTFDGGRGKTAAATKATSDKNQLDWEKLATQLVAIQKSGGTGDPRTTLRLQQRLQEMSQEEILDAFDEVAALNLPAASRSLVDQLLMATLAEKDPAEVLARFMDRLADHDEGIESQLVSALTAWAKADPRKAGAWLDEQIAAGKLESTSLDGKSPTRLRFESALLGVLLTSDLTAATGRLASLPENQRGDALGNAPFSPLTTQNLAIFAKLVRSQVPVDDQPATLARQAAQWVAQGGYPKVTEYLNATKLGPEERVACIEQAVATRLFSNNKRIAAEDLDALREWVATEAPQLTDNLTGRVLCVAAHGSRKLDFQQAADFALEYSRANGNDNVLVAFVENWAAVSDKEQARELAARITDPRLRAEVLKRLE